MFNLSALATATLIGTVLQVAMVVVGHSIPSVAALFAVGGMGISLLAGALYVVLARGVGSAPIVGAALAGALCGLIGIAVSFWLGDVTAMLLLAGTASSAVTGAIGGMIARMIGLGRAPAPGGAPRG